jgi:flagellar hook-length control protein FliK
MPAITAAANPVAAISPASATGKPASGNDAPDRSFSSVLAEQSGHSPKSVSGTQSHHETPKPKTPASAKDAATAEAATPATDGQVAAQTSVATERPQAGAGDTEAEILEMQIQAIAELMQGIQPPTANPAAQEVQPVPVAAPPALALAVTVGSDIPGAQVEGDPPPQSVTALQSTKTLPVQEQAAASASPMTAKVAAAADTAAAPLFIDAGKLPAAEPAAAKIDIALNVPAIALPVQAAATSQANHGGEYRITTPVGSQHWESAVGNSLVVMTGSGRDRAELVLTPPQLGRVEVSITMKGDEASAIFVSANPAVRDALESALPRLREVLADAGITLGQTQIGSESPGQSAADRQTGDNARRSASGNDPARPTDTLTGTATPMRVVSRALVDTYA